MKTLFTALLCTTVVFNSLGQMNLEWLNNTELNAASNAIKQGPDGNLYFITKDEFGGIGNVPNFIQKISQDGELIWQFGEGDFFDGMNSHYLDFEIDSDNNVYVVGTQFNANDQYPKTEIIKIDQSGTEVWREDFTTTSTWSEAIQQIEITSDNRIYLIARLYDPAINTLSQALIEMATDGTTVFQTIDTNYDLPLQYLYITPADEIFVFNDYQIKKINNAGTEEFSFIFSESEYEYSFSTFYDFYAMDEDDDYFYFSQGPSWSALTMDSFKVTKMKKDGSENLQSVVTPFPEIPNMLGLFPVYTYVDSNEEIYVCGYIFYGEQGGPNLPTVDDHLDTFNSSRGGKGGTQFRKEFVLKLNSDLSLAWAQDYNFMNIGNEVIPAGGFFHQDNFVYQTAIQDGQMVLPYFISHNDLNGEIIWTHTQQPTELFSTFQPSSVITGDDQAIYTFGRGELFIDDQMQYQSRYVSKYMLEDFVNIAEQENQTFRLYPNPANDFINIESKSSVNHYVIYDSTGRIVLQKTESTSNFRIPLHTLAPGVYIFNLNGETARIVTRD